MNEETSEFIFIVQNGIEGTEEHDVIFPVISAAGISFVSDAVFPVRQAETQCDAGSFIGDASVHQKQKQVTGFQVFTVFPEDIGLFGYTVDHFRHLCYDPAVTLRQICLMSAIPDDVVDIQIKRPFTVIEQWSCYVNFHMYFHSVF